MSQIIEHKGIVTHIDSRYIHVTIVQRSACSECHARGMCSAAESKEKTIEIENRNYAVREGDTVTIAGSSAMGLKAVFWAFILPLVLIMAVLFAASLCGIKEIWGALATACIVVCYIFVLSFFNKKLKNKFQFQIKQSGSEQ